MEYYNYRAFDSCLGTKNPVNPIVSATRTTVPAKCNQNLTNTPRGRNFSLSSIFIHKETMCGNREYFLGDDIIHLLGIFFASSDLCPCLRPTTNQTVLLPMSPMCFKGLRSPMKQELNTPNATYKKQQGPKLEAIHYKQSSISSS